MRSTCFYLLFLTGKVLTLFSVNFWSTSHCQPTVGNVLVTCWLTVGRQVTDSRKKGNHRSLLPIYLQPLVKVMLLNE